MACNYLSMVGLKLIHVSKWAQGCNYCHTIIAGLGTSGRLTNTMLVGAQRSITPVLLTWIALHFLKIFYALTLSRRSQYAYINESWIISNGVVSWNMSIGNKNLTRNYLCKFCSQNIVLYLKLFNEMWLLYVWQWNYTMKLGISVLKLLLISVSHLIYIYIYKYICIIRFGWQWQIRYIHSLQQDMAFTFVIYCCLWWHHQMYSFSALLAICAGNSSVTGDFPAQRPVTRSFDVSFDLRQNIRLSK